MRLYYRLFFTLTVFLFLPFLTFAGNVSVTSNVTIVLPSDNSTYTLSSGSAFNQLDIQVNATSFSFTIPTNDTVTIVSLDRRSLDNSLGTATVCGTSQSTLTLSPSSLQTVTITPNGTCTTSVSTAAKGNGPPGLMAGSQIFLSLLPTSTSTTKKILPVTGMSSTTSPLFKRVLKKGNQGSDVVTLQKFLVQKKMLVLPKSTPFGYFGNATEKALVRYQRSKKIDPIGIVGPKTQKAITEDEKGF